MGNESDNRLYIAHYFNFRNDKQRVLTSQQIAKRTYVRNKLNSFSEEEDAYKWLYDWRTSNYNRSEDEIIFGIPKNLEVEYNYIGKGYNYYYNKEKQYRILQIR